MPDRIPRDPEGRRAPYELPSGYGAARGRRSAPLPESDLDAGDDHAEVAAAALRPIEPDPVEVVRTLPVDDVDTPPEDTGIGTAVDSTTSETTTSSNVTPQAGTSSADQVSEEPEPRTRHDYVRAARDTGPTRPPTSRGKRLLRVAVLVVVLALAAPVAWSYADALRRPGTDSIGVRTVEWIRDHGGNGLVNTIERWWYTNNPPPTGGAPGAIKVQGTAGNATATTRPTAAPPEYQHLAAPTVRVPTPAAQVEQNEGVWQPTGRLVAGIPAVYTTYVRPDAAHTSFYTGVMWLDTRLLKTVYVVGLQEPGGGPNPWNSQIPSEQRGSLIAAFNSGFKIDSARGGAYLDGQTIKPLRDGAASLVITNDGTASVGVWGRDFTAGPSITAVRQNLELLVDNGQLNPALKEDDTTVFGATLGNNVFVWRSGVGVDAQGALIYAGGPAMSVTSLARTLQAAGAVRAMELDINTDWVSAYTYRNENPQDIFTPVIGDKLLPNMSRAGDRYFSPGERDFFALFASPKVVAPATTAPRSSSTTSTTRR